MTEKQLDRLQDLKRRKKITYEKLGNLLNVSKDVGGNYLTGRTDMSDDELAIVANEYGVTVAWLKGEDEKLPDHVNDPTSEYTRRRPARGGRGPAPTQRKPRLAHVQHIIALFTEWLEKMPDGQYDMFPVEGTSMLPTVCEGDELVCKMVTVDEIIDGRVYVLVLNKPELTEYRESGIWVKRVYHRKKNEYLSCKSDNKESTEPFITFQVNVADVEQVWYICGRLTGYLADPNRDIYERLDEIESRLEMLEADSGME